MFILNNHDKKIFIIHTRSWYVKQIDIIFNKNE